MAWRLSLLTTEKVVPDPRSYSTAVEDLESYQVPLAEIAQVYASKSWEVIASPPTPQFPQDDWFPDLARFVKDTQDFYRKHALVLWERTHTFIPAADGRALFGSAWMTTSEYLKKRRDRNSKLTQPLLKHYTRLLALTQYPGLDADFLLDPFHYWAPVYGALLVAPKLHQSLVDAVTAAELATPGRLYFHGPGGDCAFIEAIGLDQDRMAEIKRKFAALSPAADVQLQPLPAGSPSLPTFGDGGRTDDHSGESGTGNATEVISDALTVVILKTRRSTRTRKMSLALPRSATERSSRTSHQVLLMWSTCRSLQLAPQAHLPLRRHLQILPVLPPRPRPVELRVARVMTALRRPHPPPYDCPAVACIRSVWTSICPLNMIQC